MKLLSESACVSPESNTHYSGRWKFSAFYTNIKAAHLTTAEVHLLVSSHDIFCTTMR